MPPIAALIKHKMNTTLDDKKAKVTHFSGEKLIVALEAYENCN